MTPILRALPLVALLAAAPAFAATADQHAGHHPKGKAAAARSHKAKTAEMSCPMHDQMADGAMKPGEQMHCMEHMKAMPPNAEGQPKADPDAAAHDHDHGQPK